MSVCIGADLTTKDGAVYKHYSVTRVDPDGLSITHSVGVTKIPFEQLPDNLARKYHFDPAKAAAYRADMENARKAESEQHHLADEKTKTEPKQADVNDTEELTEPLIVGLPQSVGEIKLRPYWDTNMQGATATMGDLYRLLSENANASSETSTSSKIELWRGISYLTQLNDAVQRLGLGTPAKSRINVLCPGFPRDSIYYNEFDGYFEGNFNRLYLVTDIADQIVSAELACEIPQRGSRRGDQDWYCYNFVTYRVKAMPRLLIRHEVDIEQQGNLIQIDTFLIDPEADPDVREAVRWFLPKPLARLILFCVEKSGQHM